MGGSPMVTTTSHDSAPDKRLPTRKSPPAGRRRSCAYEWLGNCEQGVASPDNNGSPPVSLHEPQDQSPALISPSGEAAHAFTGGALGSRSRQLPEQACHQLLHCQPAPLRMDHAVAVSPLVSRFGIDSMRAGRKIPSVGEPSCARMRSISQRDRRRKGSIMSRRAAHPPFAAGMVS
jgi:hypothetical protein